MPYKSRVTGHYTGTTDESIQWAAAKHGIGDLYGGLGAWFAGRRQRLHRPRPPDPSPTARGRQL